MIAVVLCNLLDQALHGNFATVYANSEQRRAALPIWTHFYNWYREHHGINLQPPTSRLSLSRKNVLTLHS